MKAIRTKILLVVAVVAAVGGYIGFRYLQRPQPSFKEAVAFIRAVHAFVEARPQHGPALPASVQLRELVDGGYISPDMARRFDGSDVTLPGRRPEPQSLERAEEEVLIRVRLRDGRETVMTADGSIHQRRLTKQGRR